MNEVLRKEKKFLISIEEYKRFEKYMCNFLIQDSNNKNDGYIVRSLYFDSLNDRDFEEKDAGTEIRRKIRLRLYETSQKFAVLEMKQKQGENQRKRSLKIVKEDVISLINRRYDVLFKYDESFAMECYSIMNLYCYQPKAVVQYNRKAFLAKENNTRITFDYNMVATESSYNIFDDKLLFYPVIDKYNVVMEVKYNGFLLSYIKDMLNQCNKSEISVSKYIMARNIGKNVNITM